MRSYNLQVQTPLCESNKRRASRVSCKTLVPICKLLQNLVAILNGLNWALHTLT